MSNHQHNLATYDMLFRTVRPAPISGMKTATLGVAASIRSEAKPAPPETNFDGVCVINKKCFQRYRFLSEILFISVTTHIT